MLDDINLLSQFGVDDYGELILSQLEFADSSIEPKVVSSTQAKINQVVLVTDNRLNLGFEVLKQIIASSSSATECLIVETNEIKVAQLNSKSLVIFESNWLNQSELFRQLKLVSTTKAGIISLDDYDLDWLKTVEYLIKALINYQVLDKNDKNQLSKLSAWLKSEALQLMPGKSLARNVAKQLAVMLVGKSILIIPSQKTWLTGQFFKSLISINSHNIVFLEPITEIITYGYKAWTALPVERPFGVVDLISKIDDPIYNKHLKSKNRILSGLMPSGQSVVIKGESELEISMYGYLLAAFTSMYLAVLNKQPLPKS